MTVRKLAHITPVANPVTLDNGRTLRPGERATVEHSARIERLIAARHLNLVEEN